MKKLNLPGVNLSAEDYASKGNAIIGIRDSGKTYTATLIAEQLLDAGIPFVTFDPIGIWHHMKKPGAGKAYKIVVAGGEHGDLPLFPDTAVEVVRAAMRENIPLVLDLYSMEMSKSDWRQIVESCLRVLLYENKKCGLRHIFIEEAAEFCPQVVAPESGRVYAEVEKLARMGGNASLGYTLINQRSEQVNKAVLELCESLFLHRQRGKNSLEAIRKWLDYAEGGSKEIVRSLPHLPSGECWAWVDGNEAPHRLKIPTKNSLHPDRKKPEIARAAKSTNVGEFVEKLKGNLEETLLKAKENDPADLKRQILDLQRQLAAKPKTEQVEVPLLTPEQQAQIGDLSQRITTLADSLKGIQRPDPRKFTPKFDPKPPVARETNLARAATVAFRVTSDTPTGGMKRMMIALAQRGGLNKRQLGVRAGLSSTSGTFGTYMAKLRTSGFIQETGEEMYLTQAGLDNLGEYSPLPTGEGLRSYWIQELGGGAARMLEELCLAYPDHLTKEELGSRTGLAHTSGTFGTYLSRLRTLELVEGKSELIASSELF